MTREEIERVARAWASMDGKADPALEDTEGRYGGYMADAEELLKRSGVLDTARLAAEAAMAAVVQRAEVLCQIEVDRGDRNGVSTYAVAARACRNAIRDLAPPDGKALLDGLRAERDAALAQLAEAQAREAGMRGALGVVAEEATSAEIPGGYLPLETEDWHRGYDAAIGKARAALASPAPKGEP